MHATNSRTADKFVVRLPDGMRERVAGVARQNHRSMNSEIIERLEQSLLSDERADGQASSAPDQLKAELARAYKIIDRLLRNATPTSEDIQDVLHLVRNPSPLPQPHIAAVGA